MSVPTAHRRIEAGAATGNSLVVSEIFGPTFQGEGPSLGLRCSFLRLGGCNLSCSWCDTAYTWDWKGRNGTRYHPRDELRRRTVDEICADLLARGAAFVVISGGEPLLQQTALVPLLEFCHQAGWRVEVETAGSISPATATVELVDQFNVSLKLANSQNRRTARYRPAAIDVLAQTGKAIWKFVVVEASDLEEVDELVSRHSLRPVYVMPEGVQPDILIRRTEALVAPVLARGWNLTTRLHILVQGNRRGV